MERKQVIFVADCLDNAYKFQHVLADMDVDVTALSAAQFEKSAARKHDYDLVIFESHDEHGDASAKLEQLLAGESGVSALFVVTQDALANFRLPVQLKSDFVVDEASEAECAARVRQLLWPGSEQTASELITVGDMTINLATYQVTIGDEPLDLTYLEYALLSFLAAHPGRTFSRDALLQRVWGFDYYGGSRTVDVHVRRIRSKLGPDLAQHLETVRGVGYLWQA
ncbi:MAG: winged helix-turn-helix domain-containing protein [Eggerthellaceae bacterium]|nr:winged helix-turn-helix domain-containing protein [Eggerthellaceae bacterium]